MSARGLWVLVGILILALILVVGTRKSAQSDETASAAIVMLLDNSSSMAPAERAWQLQALIEVFADPAVERRLAANERGWVAVTVVRYSTNPEMPPVIPWTALRAGNGSVQAFRAQLIELAAVSYGGGSTGHSQAFDAAFGLLAVAPPADRLIIDLQTDGYGNDGGAASTSGIAAMERARAMAWAANVILNVLIVGETANAGPGLVNYHWAHTATGMVWDAQTYDGYRKALQTKILGEIS